MHGLRLYGPVTAIALWAIVRAVATPAQTVWLTVVGMALMVASVVIITVTVQTARVHSLRIRLAPAAGGAIFLLFVLVASGDLAWVRTPVTRPLGISANGISLLSPALNGILWHHFFFYLPLFSLVATAAVAVLLAVALARVGSAAERRTGASALGAVGIVPATLVAPAACGPSLLAALGVGAGGALSALAVPMLALSAVLLIALIWRLRPQHREDHR